MSRYGRSDYDDMAYELDEFLNNHKPSELLELVKDAVDWWEERNMEVDDDIGAFDLRDVLSNIEAKKRIHLEEVDTSWTYTCSICGTFSRLKYNYCPNCGADMRENNDGRGIGRID